ncbi:MAG: ABC transporter permease subunit [Chloroflexi bacterium]|nr:ABC transporter permease subunit [Chloroflexota bacterium]MBU1746143.1 ABC transporter permease subunit [Chloroflexota bacterium]
MKNPILRALVFSWRRFLGYLGSLLVVVTLLFVLLQVGPGGMTSLIAPRLNAEARAQISQEWGLDRPWPEQYGNFVSRMLTGDYGTSFTMGAPVTEVFERYATNSIQLWLLAVLFSLVPAFIILGLGLLTLWLRDRMPLLGNGLRRLGQWLAAGWLLVPVMVTGVTLWAILAMGTQIFPLSGMYNPREGQNLGQLLQHAFLPALSLALLPAYLVARSVAGEFAHYAGRRDVNTPGLVIHAICHLLAAGLIQGVGILGGLVVIEIVFSWPGIGRLLYQAASERDLPLLLGLTMIALWAALLLRVFSDAFRVISLGLSGWLDAHSQTVERRPAPRLDRVLGLVWVILAVVLVLVPLLVGLGGASIAPYDPLAASARERLAAPGGAHLLGTDQLGRDVLSRILYAMRLDLGQAILMALGALVPAALVGLLAGFFARQRTVWADLLDGLLMFPAEALTTLPGFALLLVVSSTWVAMSRDAPIDWLPMTILIGALYVLPRLMRLLREGAATIPTQGGSGRTILRLLGMSGGALLVAPALGLFALSTMAFLGLGTAPPAATLGSMIRESLQFAARAEGLPWATLIPAFAIVFLTGGWFLLAETVLTKIGVHKRESWLDINR